MSFIEKLDDESMAFFNKVAAKPFSGQATAFLNAYWAEIGSEAEFIYSVSWEIMKHADMNAKGIQLVHKYEEGVSVDFDIGLYFFEQLCKFWEEPSHSGFVVSCGPWGKSNSGFQETFAKSAPEMMTSIVRKKELREKVDVNFDGRVSFLEFLLYQYKDFANPADFTKRSMKAGDEHPEITKARLALEEVNARIREYEEYKQRLETESELPGVKGLKAKNLLAQLDSSPLKEELNKALITAEAAVRKATRLFGGQSGAEGDSGPTQGSLWWMNYDLDQKKKKYGKK